MKKYLFLLIVLVLFFSCENDTSSPDDQGPTQMGLDGLVQKGPFITGSTIIVQELNDEFSPNGTSFNVTTEDNFGSFSLNSEVSTDFIEIISEGFYFNEVSGTNTDVDLSLRALSSVSDSLSCNINILTTLAKKRIVYLINEEEKTYNEAKQQAQNEILDIFSIHEAGVEDFEKMDISQNRISDAILLAISVVLQGSNSVSELSFLISTIIEDIDDDGIVDERNGVNNQIYDNAKNLNLVEVRNNIETRYDDLGIILIVPDFEKYVNDMWKKQCTIISPLNNQTFNYNDSMTVNIDDFASYINILSTKYYLDGDLFSEDIEYPFEGGVKLHNLDFGNHLLKVVATDDSSNVYADSINVIVNTPDDFTIVSPYNNASFNLNDSIYINISSQPDYLEVTNVKCFFDDTMIAEINSEPFTYNYLLDNINMCGARQIKSEVTDETGRITYDAVNINVLTPDQFTLVSPVANTGYNLNDLIYMSISSQPDYLEVTNVKYYFDDLLISEISDEPFTYNYLLDNINMCGAHQIKSEVTDETGRISYDSVAVNITTPDQFTLISPSEGEIFNSGDTISIEISDTPDFINVSYVEYYYDDTIIQFYKQKQFSYDFALPDPETPGIHEIKSVVTDETGRTTMDSVLITVNGMIFVEGGTFDMGDQFNEGGSSEIPVHSVSLSNFYIGMTEITQSEWLQYMPSTAVYTYGAGDNFPVYYIDWYKIIKYCALRSIDEGLTQCYSINGSTDPADWGVMPYYDWSSGSVEGDQAAWDAVICNWNANGYRLPTEAEWEYAGRGGINFGDNFRYSGSNIIADVAWYASDLCHIVAGKAPNQLGIYDMSGNVWEWCWDWYSDNYYTTCNDLGVVTDPTGPSPSTYRVFRGGYFEQVESGMRVAGRGAYFPDYGHHPYGFRVARTP